MKLDRLTYIVLHALAAFLIAEYASNCFKSDGPYEIYPITALIAGLGVALFSWRRMTKKSVMPSSEDIIVYGIINVMATHLLSFILAVTLSYFAYLLGLRWWYHISPRISEFGPALIATLLFGFISIIRFGLLSLATSILIGFITRRVFYKLYELDEED